MDEDKIEIGRYNEHENVYDFIEFKMLKLVDVAAHAGRVDVAEVISDMLDSYMLNHIDIVFVSGWPFTAVKPEDLHKLNPEQY